MHAKKCLRLFAGVLAPGVHLGTCELVDVASLFSSQRSSAVLRYRINRRPRCEKGGPPPLQRAISRNCVEHPKKAAACSVVRTSSATGCGSVQCTFVTIPPK